MKPEEIHLNDWMRILIGDVPGVFYIELFFRCIFFYLLLVVCMRLMGKRMSGQLSRNEMLSLVALAAAIGIPLTSPYNGVVPGVISCIIIVLGERALSSWFTKSRKVETLTQGFTGELVADGILNVASLKEAHISRDRVLSQLRSEGLKQLGRVKRLYFEQNGSLTLVKDESKKTGLNILPEEDKSFTEVQKAAEELVCSYCGKPKDPSKTRCDNCNHSRFVNAITVE